jgi:hypothetical protein
MSIRRVSFASCAVALVLGCSGSSASDVGVGSDPGGNNANPSNKTDAGKTGFDAGSGGPLGGSDGGGVDPGTDSGGGDPGTDAGIGGGKVDSGGAPPVTGFPQPSGACPAFTAGDVTFHPKGGDRKVAVTLGDPSKKGPLVFYWYATTSSPAEAQYGLPITAVKAAGSIVIAPYDVANAGQFPWLSNVAQHEALFDEVLGCAVQNNLIDTKHIHTIGFSAGALMTTQLSYDRSKYLASVATYSGGGPGTFQDPNNKFAAMIMTGGANDQVVQDFFKSSTDWQTTLKGAGHFAMLCNHGGGHSIPQKLVPGVWQFFLDHPYGTNPSPYAGHIPSTIAPPCVE